MLAKSLFAIHLNGAIHFKEMEMRTNLHRTIARIAYLQLGHRTAGIEFNFTLSRDDATNTVGTKSSTSRHNALLQSIDEFFT